MTATPLTKARAAPTDSKALATRYQTVLERIRKAERRYGREHGSVSLIAVSKTQPTVDVEAVHALGQSAFGENHLQEAIDKIAKLGDKPLVWHFIGHIQNNKCRLIATQFDWVHSVDRIKTAQRLANLRPEGRPALNVLIQVNLEGEISKSGAPAEDVMPLATAIAHQPRLRLRGLMAIPSPSNDFDHQRQIFSRLRDIRDELIDQGYPIDCLSMGMTDDLEAAIAEGATHVRIGTAIFGPRRPRHE